MAAPRFIPRSEWLATFTPPVPKDSEGRPVNQWRPSSLQQYVDAEVKGQTIHWPGGNRYQLGVSDPFRHLRSMQQDYRLNRGYDLGYNYVVSARPGEAFGWVFEARGLHRSAAQGDPSDPEDENGENVAIQLVVDLDGRVDQSQVNAVHWIVRELLWPRWPKARRQLGHRDVDSGTSCPGDVIEARVKAGHFQPVDTGSGGGDWFDMATEAELRKIVQQEVAKTGGIVWAEKLPHPTPGAPAAEASKFMFYILRNTADLYTGTAPGAVSQVEFDAAVAAILEAVTGMEPGAIAKVFDTVIRKAFTDARYVYPAS